MIHLQQRLLVLYWILCGTGISQWKDWNRGVTWSVLRKKISSVRGEQHSSACDEGYGLRKQTDRKGVNCGSRGVTEWVMWPVSLFLLSLTWFSPAPTPPPPTPELCSPLFASSHLLLEGMLVCTGNLSQTEFRQCWHVCESVRQWVLKEWQNETERKFPDILVFNSSWVSWYFFAAQVSYGEADKL